MESKKEEKETKDNDSNKTMTTNTDAASGTISLSMASMALNEDLNLWIDTDGDSSDSLDEIGAGCSITNGGGRLFVGTKVILHDESSKFNNRIGIVSGHFTKTNYRDLTEFSKMTVVFEYYSSNMSTNT